MTAGDDARVIVKSVVLECAVERAWEVFTTMASEWWPPERRHTKDPASTIVIEAGGRFVEVSGTHEVALGVVRVWDPPRRLELDWYPGTDAAHPTFVVVTFAAVEGGTRVTVEHRPGPDSGDLWDGRAPRYDASWDLVLAALARHVGG